MAADELEPVEAGAVVMTMPASECSRGFWDIRVNVFAAAFAVIGPVLSTLLVVITGEYSLNAGILCGLGVVGIIWLPYSWIRWKRGQW